MPLMAPVDQLLGIDLFHIALLDDRHDIGKKFDRLVIAAFAFSNAAALRADADKNYQGRDNENRKSHQLPVSLLLAWCCTSYASDLIMFDLI